MRSVSTLVVALALVGLANSATATDPTGAWKSSITLGDKTFESALLLYLDSEGPVLTGFEKDEERGPQRPLAKATYKGTKIHFVVNHESGGEPVVINYQGVVSGDTIVGKATFEFSDRSQPATWTAKRLNHGRVVSH